MILILWGGTEKKRQKFREGVRSQIFGGRLGKPPTPHIGETIFSSIPLRLGLGPLKGILRRQGVLQGPSTLCHPLLSYLLDTVSCAAQEVKVPGYRHEQLLQTLLRLLKIYLLFLFHKLESPGPLAPHFRTPWTNWWRIWLLCKLQHTLYCAHWLAIFRSV